MKEVRPELYNKLKAQNNLIPPEISPDAYSFPAIDEMIKTMNGCARSRYGIRMKPIIPYPKMK